MMTPVIQTTDDAAYGRFRQRYVRDGLHRQRLYYA